MFAVIRTGGNSTASPQRGLKVEKLAGEPGETITFPTSWRWASDAGATIGSPMIAGASSPRP